MLNRTIAENNIHISNKKLYFEYDEVIKYCRA